MTGSQWADANYYMSAESSASPGKWKTLPYQRGWMDACTDPAVEEVSVQKSARTGFTQSIGAIIGYYMEHDPCPMSVVQPTLELAEIYSKEFIAPMLRATPVLSKIMFEDSEEKAKDSNNKILHKHFPGGVLSLIGANSGAGFRMVSRRVMFYDEPDGYTQSAGKDGDQLSLGKRRTEAYWNRKNIAGCTPLISGTSKIEELYKAGDQRRYYVPCPHCSHMDYLTFRETREGGHYMRWDKDDGSDAHFICRKCGCEIEHKHKNGMVARGEWRAHAPFKGHASFHIWAAYSPNINASWAQIASEWIAADKSKNPEKLKTFINTVLGEVWEERGDSPDWEKLYNRREPYRLNTIPEGALFLTAGLDVQKDRVVYEVTGWGRERCSWVIDTGVLPGDTSDHSEKGPWTKVFQLLGRVWERKNGFHVRISMLAVDSGAFTQSVYQFAWKAGAARVMAVKGDDGIHRQLVASPTVVDVDWEGQRVTRGTKKWLVGSDVAKNELYGWMRLKADGEVFPPGYLHFSQDLGEDYFKQITAEQLVPHKLKNGRVLMKWEPKANQENHWLDCKVYSRAAAFVVGLDRFTESDWTKLEELAGLTKPPDVTGPAEIVTTPDPEFHKSSTMIPDSGKRWIKPRQGWLKKR